MCIESYSCDLLGFTSLWKIATKYNIKGIATRVGAVAYEFEVTNRSECHWKERGANRCGKAADRITCKTAAESSPNRFWLVVLIEWRP